MKGGTLQIVWHDALPVLSLDFDSETGLLATAGADHDIKLWAVLLKEEGKGSPTVSFKANLAFHTTAVNIIRFSPSGELLASGADGGHLAVWKRAGNAEGVATWKILKPLSFHPKDVLDLEWSPDGTFLISGSVDNSCIIWNVAKGAPLQVLKDHLHYVQGVAWDPTGQYVATVSGDRTCRIYSPRAAKGNSKAQEKSAKDGLPKFVCQHVLAKVSVRTSEDVPMQVEDADIPATKTASSSKQHLFHDENLPTFFRRLAWSPEGSFLLIPAGIYKPTADAGPFNTTCVVSRKDLSRPCLQLPCGKKAVVAVRFCPVIFTLRSNVETGTSPDTDGGVFRLPYRMVFAVATLNSLYIYDTQSDSPVLVFAALHYSAITDLAWSANAKFLAASSQDGYCTLLGFDEGELGDPMPLTAIPPHIASYLPEARRRKLAGTLGELSSPKQDSAAVESSQQAKATDTKAEPDALLNKQQPPVGNQFQGPATMAQLSEPKRQITPVCDPKASEADVRTELKSIDTDLTLVKKPRRVTPVPIKDGL